MSIRIATDAVVTEGSRPGPLGRLATGGRTREPQGSRTIALARPYPARLGASQDERDAHLIFRLAGHAGTTHGDQPLGAATNWVQLMQLAWDEGAVSALRDHCARLPAGTVPVDVERRLACMVLDRELRMRILEARLTESVARLTTAGIDVALLKGAALAKTVYGSFGARPMKDIDILVRPAETERAKQLMLGIGWERDGDLPGDSVYTTHHHLAPLRDVRGSRSRLEIHRSLLPYGHPFELSMVEPWSAMGTVDVGETRAWALDPHHHAVHIAIHFAWSHVMRAGAWNAFRDLCELEGAGAIDWSRLVEVATGARAASCCYWTLTLARRMTGLPVPDGVLDLLAPRMSSALLDRLERHFVNVLVRRDPTHLSIRVDRALWNLAIQPARQGHGDARPWTVSRDLTVARLRRERAAPAEGPLRRMDRVARCTAYVAGLLWS